VHLCPPTLKKVPPPMHVPHISNICCHFVLMRGSVPNKTLLKSKIFPKVFGLATALLLMMPFKWTLTKSFALSISKRKSPMLRQQSQKTRFVVSNTQVYYDNLRNRLSICRFSKQGTSFERSIAMVFKERCMAMVFDETTNDDLILPSKTRQCHLQTRAANFWDLDQSDQ